MQRGTPRGKPQPCLPYAVGCGTIILVLTLIIAGRALMTPQPTGSTSRTALNQPSSSTPTPMPPTPTPTLDPAFHGLTVDSAAEIVAAYYNQRGGDGSGDYMMSSIASMTLPLPQHDQIVACVAYRDAFKPTPDQPIQGYPHTATFILSFDGTTWQVSDAQYTSATYTACRQNDDGTIPGGQTPRPFKQSAPPPGNNLAAQLVTAYFNTKYQGQYTMQSIQQISFGKQVGDYIGACVYFTFTYQSGVNSTDHHDFGFQYQNTGWLVDSIGDVC